MTLEGALIEDLTATGPVTAANAMELGDLYDAVQTATFGVALLDVMDAQLARVATLGYAEAGLVGSRDLKEFAFVGRVVNVAARLQDWTRESDAEIIVSAVVREALDPLSSS